MPESESDEGGLWQLDVKGELQKNLLCSLPFLCDIGNRVL